MFLPEVACSLGQRTNLAFMWYVLYSFDMSKLGYLSMVFCLVCFDSLTKPYSGEDGLYISLFLFALVRMVPTNSCFHVIYSCVGTYMYILISIHIHIHIRYIDFSVVRLLNFYVRVYLHIYIYIYTHVYIY